MEALTGFRHIHRPDGLSNTLLSQGCVLGAALTMGMVGRMFILRTEEEMRSLWLPGSSSWVNQQLCPLRDLFQQWLPQPKLIFSLFWRLEVSFQGVGRVGSSCSLSPWLADACLLLCPYMVFPLCRSVSSPPLPRTPVMVGQGPL